MTILVCVGAEDDAQVLRRWVRDERTEGKLVLTHVGYIDAPLIPETVRSFREAPPLATRVGFVNDYERAWEPTAA